MGFHPSEPVGRNQTENNAISNNGIPELGKRYAIAARTACAVRLKAGQTLTVINPHGTQVCDFWAFRDPNVYEYLSMAHCHTALGSIMFHEGDTLVTIARTSLLTITRDTSPGIHDTVIAACDAPRYEQLGVEGYHDNCTDNLRMAMNAIGETTPAIPAPFNIWMNIPVDKDGNTSWGAPVSQPGDEIDLKALEDCIAVMSACPQDVTPVNGEGLSPVELAFIAN